MKKTIIASAMCVALLSGCAAKNSITQQEVLQQYPTINEAQTLLDSAKSENLSFYSPEQIKAAQRVFDESIKQAKSGKSDASTLAKEAVDRVKAAQRQAQKVKYVFEDVFDARQRALAANANTMVPEAYNAAEKQLSKMIGWLELGEDEKAKRDINALENQYLDIELTALKSDMLSVAEQAIEHARKNEIDDVAPRTVALAKDEYQLALATLEADRSDIVKANVHSNRAIWLVERAKGIAEINKYFDNAKFDDEQKILWYQEQLGMAFSPLINDIEFNQANKEVVAYLREELSQIVADKQGLNTSLSSMQSQLKEVKETSITREIQLAKAKDEAVLAGQLELEKQQNAKREDDARFAGVQSLFTEDEATVYRQINNVLIRAQGFSFKPGNSEIESSNFILLNKIIDAIGRFPDAKIVISGHTDVTGSDELNLNLSKARAQTVANFITQVGKVNSARVQSTGFGKEKPVASNETAEGRAQNRRVEILIVN
ncbi:MAG: OOP family OmpA-OmpF porin [Paraglaciecola sp.]|jgi:OOP family OmpA-OmpF porin